MNRCREAGAPSPSRLHSSSVQCAPFCWPLLLGKHRNALARSSFKERLADQLQGVQSAGSLQLSTPSQSAVSAESHLAQSDHSQSCD